MTRNEAGDWLLTRDLESVCLLDLYRTGHRFLPVSETLEIPSSSEWDEAFFRSVSLGELNMRQSLKEMYQEPT